jgi:hypothetical protein
MPETTNPNAATGTPLEEQVRLLSEELEKKQKYIKILEEANKEL